MSDGFHRPLGLLDSTIPGGELWRKIVKVEGGGSLGGTRNDIASPPPLGEGRVGATRLPPPLAEGRVGAQCRFIPRAAASSRARCSAERFGGTLDGWTVKTWAGPTVARTPASRPLAAEGMVGAPATAGVCGAASEKSTPTIVPKAATPLPLSLMSDNITGVSSAVKLGRWRQATRRRQTTSSQRNRLDSVVRDSHASLRLVASARPRNSKSEGALDADRVPPFALRRSRLCSCSQCALLRGGRDHAPPP